MRLPTLNLNNLGVGETVYLVMPDLVFVNNKYEDIGRVKSAPVIIQWIRMEKAGEEFFSAFGVFYENTPDIIFTVKELFLSEWSCNESIDRSSLQNRCSNE
tara:strand:- start:348 stop:650 length:303 start_codon:yes stop_codon:yes gene_type:complete